jgi:hypothetical protein
VAIDRSATDLVIMSALGVLDTYAVAVMHAPSPSGSADPTFFEKTGKEPEKSFAAKVGKGQQTGRRGSIARDATPYP